MSEPLANSVEYMFALSSRIAEAEQRFNEAMDALMDLRQQLAEILSPMRT